MIKTACCFTGHRHIPIEQKEDLTLRLETVIKMLFTSGVTQYYAGGALGFDMMAAETVLKLKKHESNVRLSLILPCQNQAKYWQLSDVKKYDAIKNLADEVIFTSQNYSKACMHIRNRALVDKSDICVCYLEKDTGGTAYTVNYARSKNRRIINLATPDSSIIF